MKTKNIADPKWKHVLERDTTIKRLTAEVEKWKKRAFAVSGEENGILLEAIERKKRYECGAKNMIAAIRDAKNILESIPAAVAELGSKDGWVLIKDWDGICARANVWIKKIKAGGI